MNRPEHTQFENDHGFRLRMGFISVIIMFAATLYAGRLPLFFLAFFLSWSSLK